MGFEGFGIRLFTDLLIPAGKIVGKTVRVGNTLYQTNKAKQREEKIKQATKLLSEAEKGDFALYQQALESYQAEEFDNAMYYARAAIEKGERARAELFGED